MNVKPALLLAAMSIGFGLAGCGPSNRNSGLTVSSAAGPCTPFKGADAASPPAGAPANGSAAVEECLHRWGYALASAKETADVVAAATVTACSGPVANWNQQALGQASQQQQQQQDQPEEPTSLTTGEPTNPMAEHAQFAQSEALFYVVQARAGKCAPPPDRLLVRDR
jgi:hypothetical protein